MKIIEAMRAVKANREKISDLQGKIRDNSAHLSHEKSPYDNPAAKVDEWAQSCCDLTQENARLLTAISRTNLATVVPIQIGGKSVSKPIAEWIWRRREFAETDLRTFAGMTDRGLQTGSINTSTGEPLQIEVVRNYNAERRDLKMHEYREEPHLIDAALEIVNATTDLVEAP